MSNKGNAELFGLTEEWFARIPDRTENGLREFLKGERPIDAGASVTRKVSNKSSLLVYNYDLETIRYKLRRKFSESVKFDRAEINHLKSAFNLNDFQAEALRFFNLLVLRDEFVKDCLEIYEQFVFSTLTSAFKAIEQDSFSDALRQFRKVSRKTKNIFAEGIGLSYIERLKQNAHLFIKTPNVGRPPDKGDKTGKVKLAIKQILNESFEQIGESNLEEVLSGKIVLPRATKSKVAANLKISRPQFDKWLRASNLDFEELLITIQNEFYQSLRTKKTFS